MKLDWEVEDYLAHVRPELDFDREKMRLSAGLFESCIPIGFWNVKESDVMQNKIEWNSMILPYCNQLSVARKNGYSLYLEGDNGVGKTMAMSFVLKESIRQGFSSYYTTALDLDADLKRGFANAPVGERMNELFSYDFFALDELSGEQTKSGDGWMRAQVERLLKHRLDNCLPTLVATNAGPRKITAAYGASVRSIFSGKYQHVILSGGDFRVKLRDKMVEAMGYKK
jgi:DNA replication protein DnaC